MNNEYREKVSKCKNLDDKNLIVNQAFIDKIAKNISQKDFDQIKSQCDANIDKSIQEKILKRNI